MRIVNYINEIFRAIPIIIPVLSFVYYLITKEKIILFLFTGIILCHFFIILLKNVVFKYIEYFLNNLKLNKIKNILGSFDRPIGAKNCGSFYVNEHNYSSTRGMPSGHCILIGYVSIFLWHYLIEKYKIEKKNHLYLLIFCLFFCYYTMYTRVIFGCHTIEQTIIGLFIGMIYGHYYFLLGKKYSF